MLVNAARMTPITDNKIPTIIGLLNNSYFLINKLVKSMENISLEDKIGAAMLIGARANAAYLAI